MDWSAQRVLVTGGASFIGSHLVDALVQRGARVRVVDNLSSGDLDNLRDHLVAGEIDFHHEDLLDSRVAEAMTRKIDVVFHNAADHGGRGYIDLHQVNCSTNLILDGLVFRAAERAGVEKVVFASSGCVYPKDLQTDPEEILYLTEDLVRPPYNADNLYGWAKLMAEMTLRAYHAEGRMKAASLRYFTAYGPRCPESHAVMAMIARAMTGQDPFEIWGTGEQIRNWTHVSDIVEGTIRAAERIDDGTAINLGTMERTKVVRVRAPGARLHGHEPRAGLRPEQADRPLQPRVRPVPLPRGARLGAADLVPRRAARHDRLVPRHARRRCDPRQPRAHAHRARTPSPPDDVTSRQPARRRARGRPAGTAPLSRWSSARATTSSRATRSGGWRRRSTTPRARRPISGRLDDVEVIVADWGSEEPLRDAVRLSEEAARIVRFLTVPVDLAREKQRDSRFAEVFAINAAARRARGDYIGRIDQDTLVGRHFLEWFFRARSNDGGAAFPLDASVMISNRRRIPYHFAVRRPSFPVVERYVSWFDRRLPTMALTVSDNYWECYIGILLFHRRLWDGVRGIRRELHLLQLHGVRPLPAAAHEVPGRQPGRDRGHDFHHLDHTPAWLTWHVTRVRRTSSARPRPRRRSSVPRGRTGDCRCTRSSSRRSPQLGRGLAPRDARWRLSHWPELVVVHRGEHGRDHRAGCCAIRSRSRGILRGTAHFLFVSSGLWDP